jgi:DNA-binding NtrC family response regulator
MHKINRETNKTGAVTIGIPRVTNRILLIDDDPYFLRILKRLLAEEKFQATTCSNSCEALGLVRSGKFSLVICGCRGVTV